MRQNSDDENEIKELLIFLEDESKSLNETLSSARDFHYGHLTENIKQFLNFNIKIGELSLVLGAAIGPVLIASGKLITQPVFVFLAIILYLTNGIYSIVKVKESVEKQLDFFAPSNLHKLESDIYPMVFAIDKLRFDPKNQEYISEFSKVREKFLNENAETEVPKNKIDITLDINVSIFVLASLLLIKTIWPFSQLLYWASFILITVFIAVFLIKGYIQAKNRMVQNISNTKRLNEMKLAHIKWQKRKMNNKENKS